MKEFINRFGAQVVKDNTRDETMMVHAFRKGICPGPFSESLTRAAPKPSLTFGVVRWLTLRKKGR